MIWETTIGTRPLYGILAALLAASLIYQVRRTVDLFEKERERVEYRIPFELERGGRVTRAVTQEGKAAGLRERDEVVRVNGEAFEGLSLFRRLRGPEVTFEVRQGAEAERAVRMRLQPRNEQFTRLEEKLLNAVLFGAMPWLGLVLGFWAAAIHPRDKQAWLLLALMLSFSHLVDADIYHWTPGPLRVFGILYNRAMAALMPAAMVLFAVYFAAPFRPDQRLPWLKWLLIGPAAVSGAALTVFVLLEQEALRWLGPVYDFLRPLAQFYRTGVFASIGAFFMVMGWKFGTTVNPDARRRLKLLLAGTMAAMTPLFVIIVASMVLRTDPRRLVPTGMLTAALLVMFLFPLTITYVIVVHRALDLRVVVRQGIQYALAREGANVFFILLAAAVLGLATYLALNYVTSQPRKYMLISAGVILIFLLQKLRLRIAKWIDRKFFRAAYDAERVLSELSDEVRTVVDEESLLKRVGETISKTLVVPRLAFLVDEGGAYRPAFARGYPWAPEVEFGEDTATVRRLRESAEPAQVYFDDKGSWIYRAPDMTEQERKELEELQAQLLLPLAVKEKLVGILTLGPKKSEEPYSRSDLRLLRSLAAQTGLALENSRLAAEIAQEAAQRERLNREVEIAREVQQRLFPQKVPRVEGFDCAGGCRPALGVGGDYYDYLELPDGRLGIVIGDVAGKGIAAALLMASLQASVRGQTMHDGGTLAGMIADVNKLIYESSASSRYATLFYAQIDTRTRSVDYVNAGHNPPVVMRANGEVEHLTAGGTVVGLLPRFPYRQAKVQLERGDVLVMFTDGISEAFNRAEEEYGEERLMEAIRRAEGRPAAELIPYLIEDVDKFVDGAPQHDDMTLVIMRVV